MHLAIVQAQAATLRGEVPVGALVVLEDRILASAGNRTITDCDPTAHAEIVAMRQAAHVMNNYRLTGAALYVTVEPCANVRITVNAPAPVVETPKGPGFEELFAQEVRDAYFDLDKADIRPDARAALEKTASFLKGYPNAKVIIEGHCDERGSTEYNLALGDRRANAVKQYLLNLGIPAANLNVVSFGKEKPFCSESNEACWQQNRRGHFVPARQ